ncbi:MAG: hypothetical protein AB1486_08745 [Planctomycetota bacterium]
MSLLQSLYRSMRRDFGRKTLALGLAIGAFFVIRAATVTSHSVFIEVCVVKDQYERDDAQVKYRNVYIVELPPDLLVRDDQKSLTAELELVGPQAVLTGYGNWKVIGEDRLPADYCGDLDRRDYVPDDRLLRIDRVESRSDRVLRFKSPPSIQIFRAERLSVKLSPANVEITGQPQRGWAPVEDKQQQVRFKAGMETVVLIGPAGAIRFYRENPSAPLLEKFDISAGAETVEGGLRLRTYSERGALLPRVTMEPRIVTVYVDLREQREERRITDVPVSRRNMEWLTGGQGPPKVDPQHPIKSPPPDDAEAWSATVVLSARSTVWERQPLDPLREMLELWVDMRQFGELTLEDLPIRVWRPDNWPKEVQLERVEPEKIRQVILNVVAPVPEEPESDAG